MAVAADQLEYRDADSGIDFSMCYSDASSGSVRWGRRLCYFTSMTDSKKQNRPRTSTAQRQLVVKLIVDEGYSYARAAEALNLSIIQVRWALKAMGVKSPRARTAVEPPVAS